MVSSKALWFQLWRRERKDEKYVNVGRAVKVVVDMSSEDGGLTDVDGLTEFLKNHEKFSGDDGLENSNLRHIYIALPSKAGLVTGATRSTRRDGGGEGTSNRDDGHGTAVAPAEPDEWKAEPDDTVCDLCVDVGEKGKRGQTLQYGLCAKHPIIVVDETGVQGMKNLNREKDLGGEEVVFVKMEKAKRMASNTTASVETGHRPAERMKWEEDEIPCVVSPIRGELKHKQDNPSHYCSKADVARFVLEVEENVARVKQMPLEFYQEMTFNGIRPDISAVLNGNTAVGFTEVKKPKGKDGSCPLLDEKVLGELYDYMVQLPSLYGVWPAFGILSSYDEWLFCKLPDSLQPRNTSGTEYSALNSADDSFATPMKNPPQAPRTSPPRSPAPCTSCSLSCVSVESEIEDENEGTPANIERRMLASRVYKSNDDSKRIVSILAGILQGMADAQVVYIEPYLRPKLKVINKDHPEQYLPPPRFDGEKPDFIAEMPASNCRTLWLLDELGHRFRPRVFRACSRSWRLVVIKFVGAEMNPGARSAAECAMNWRKVYGAKGKVGQVRAEKWCGVDCLLMPDLHMLDVDDVVRFGTESILRAVKNTLGLFHDKMLKHEDVMMRNVALTFNGSGIQEAVLVDFDHVREYEDGDGKEWMERAIGKLQSELQESLTVAHGISRLNLEE